MYIQKKERKKKCEREKEQQEKKEIVNHYRVSISIKITEKGHVT